VEFRDATVYQYVTVPIQTYSICCGLTPKDPILTFLFAAAIPMRHFALPHSTRFTLMIS
jgi:hypothetical protein